MAKLSQVCSELHHLILSALERENEELRQQLASERRYSESTQRKLDRIATRLGPGLYRFTMNTFTVNQTLSQLHLTKTKMHNTSMRRMKRIPSINRGIISDSSCICQRRRISESRHQTNRGYHREMLLMFLREQSMRCCAVWLWSESSRNNSAWRRCYE